MKNDLSDRKKKTHENRAKKVDAQADPLRAALPDFWQIWFRAMRDENSELLSQRCGRRIAANYTNASRGTAPGVGRQIFFPLSYSASVTRVPVS